MTYFNKKFDLRGGPDESSSIVTTDSGYVVCANGYHANNGFLGVGLFFLDKNGDSLYTKWIGKDVHHYFDGWGGAFRKYSKGGFYLGGALGDTSGTIHAMLYMFDGNGDTLWTKKYGNGTDFYAFYHARETPDKGFILAGAKQQPNWSFEQGLLIKTDSLGNIQWEQVYGGNQSEYGTMVLPTSSGGYLLGGETKTIPCSAGETDQWLVKTNSSGTQQWQKCYGTIDDEGNALPGYEFSNGDFAYVGQWAQNSASWYPFVARIDNTGDTIWSRKFRPHGGADFLRNSLIAENEDILAVGKTNIMGTRGLLVRVSANGDSLWHRTYEYYSTFSVNDLWDIDTAHGGGYVMCGTTNQSSVQDVWVIKVDEHGCLFDPDCWYNQLPESPWSFAGIDENENEFFSLYPNPNNGKFFIENKTGAYSGLEIKIYTTLGEQLFSSEYNNSKTEIDLTEFANGIYFIAVSDEGGILWKTKVIKE